MTTFAGQILLCMVLLIVLHISALALMGLAFGVPLREVSYGLGKALLTRGKITIRALPFGGFVRYKSTRDESIGDEPAAENADAFDRKPRVVQAIIPLGGPAALTLIASLIPPSGGVSEVVSGFRQLVSGAFGPLSTAQAYIHAAYALATEHGFFALFGVLAAKIAAFNLLPFPTMNGGQAILTLLRPGSTDTPAWELRLTNIGLWLFVALSAAWVFSLCAFFV